MINTLEKRAQKWLKRAF